MATLSADEKRRILRERRQAKMAQGNASGRLNSILTLGSSVNTSAVSVLDKTESSTPEAEPTAVPELRAEAASVPPSHTPLHSDPEVPDISTLLHKNDLSANADEDLDAMMLKIFGAAATGERPPQNAEEASTKFFADMMKVMAEEDGTESTPQDANYQTQLAAYEAYDQRKWKARFLVGRFVVHTANFVYHYVHNASFRASQHLYVRGLDAQASSFFRWALSVEVAVVSSYFFVMLRNGSLKASSRNHMFSKLLALAGGVFPQARAYQPVLDTLLFYWGVASIFVGDAMLVVVLFGLASLLA